MTQPNPTPGDPAPTTEPTTPPANPAPTPPGGGPPKDGDKPLGPAGENALKVEREARKALEKQLQALAPLEQLAGLLGGKSSGDGKTDLERLTDRLDGYEQQITTERQARWRAEIAAETGLPPALAARLQGGTREELLADAQALQSLIPAAPAQQGPRTPAPDPSQGSRGPVDVDALIREAESKGNVRESIRLKAAKAAAARQ